jgi:nitrile hydratase
MGWMRGYVEAEELAAGYSLHAAKSLPRAVLREKDVAAAVRRGSYEQPSTSPALFKAGDRVRAKTMHPATHTRLPRYARGRSGVIERVPE